MSDRRLIRTTRAVPSWRRAHRMGAPAPQPGFTHRAAALSRGREHPRKKRGAAIGLALTAVVLLAVLVADMEQTASTSYAVAIQQRNALQAEFMAKSALNLTRLLMSTPNQQALSGAVAPVYQALLGHSGPGELPVWMAANDILKPFCDFEEGTGLGFDLGAAGGFGGNVAHCRITAQAENGKINLSTGLHFGGDQARLNTALQLFSLMGGYQAPSPYDALFSEPDQLGQLNSRLDVVAAVIDWWDPDTDRVNFDPGANQVQQAGSEDDSYARYRPPYQAKQAPFDSLAELRLVRGIGDDFWATFIEPDPEDMQSRQVTVYGSGRVNVNEAPPAVLLARTCSIAKDQALCTDPLEAAKFIQLLGTLRSMFPFPVFASGGDFVNFMQGQTTLYRMLLGTLGQDNPLVFRTIAVSTEQQGELANAFLVSAQIVSIEAVGYAGCREPWESDPSRCRTRVRIRAITNKDVRWTPPPPNPGRMPILGVIQHYRID